MAPGPRDILRRVALALTWTLLAAAPAAARSVVVDPPPWRILDDEPTLSVLLDMSDDGDSGWSSSRTGVMFRLRTSGETRAYARWAHVRYDDAGLDASARWPGIVPPEEDSDAAALAEQADWNVLDRHVGWDRPEFGLLGRTRWPLVGPVSYAVSAWLPFASNELYPYAARSISARFAVRREIAFGEPLALVLDAFLSRDMAPGGDLLSEDAMSGWTGGGALVRLRPGGSWLLETGVSTAGSGEASLKVLTLEAGRSLGEDARLRLRIEHLPGDEGDRPFATRVIAVWSLALPGGEETGDETLERPRP
jgi:hypothetical protein